MSQIFQTSYPKCNFFEFLNKFCEKNNKQYIFYKEAFKRAKLEEAIIPFCENLPPSSTSTGTYSGFKEIFLFFLLKSR